MTDDEEASTSPKWWGSAAEQREPMDLHTDVPHSARIYDYYLGGKDNFRADREAADEILADAPEVAIAAQQNRAFLQRAVRYLAGQVGVRQFLDIGTGIPTSPNLHEVAQQIAPAARVVYVDNDPIVLAHARALLTGHPEGKTAYLDADLLDPDRILEAPELRDILDLTRPVALSLLAILHFVPDEKDPAGIVGRLLDALPPGSYLTLSHGTQDFASPQQLASADAYRRRGIPIQLRSRAEFTRLLTGLEPVEPGVALIHRWRPDGNEVGITDKQAGLYAAIARKSKP